MFSDGTFASALLLSPFHHRSLAREQLQKAEVQQNLAQIRYLEMLSYLIKRKFRDWISLVSQLPLLSLSLLFSGISRTTIHLYFAVKKDMVAHLITQINAEIGGIYKEISDFVQHK